MRIMKERTRIIILYLFLLLFLIPVAAAYSTGIPPLNQGVELISSLFNIDLLRSNEDVQVGFIKFLLFITIFAVFRQALLKAGGVFQEPKTAGIVSFSVSAIGVFLMPRSWLLATGGAITALVSASVFLAIFLGVSYLAVMKLNKDALQNLFGLLLLVLLLMLLNIWAGFTGLGTM